MKTIWILAVAGFVQLGFADAKPSIAHLPAAVQQTIRENTGNGELKKVKTKRGDDGTVYEIEYKERGDEKELVIGSDGRVLSERDGKGGKGKNKDKGDDKKAKGKDKQGRDEVKGVERATSPTAPRTQRPVPAATRKVVQYSETPEKVRQVAGQHLKGGHVEKVERLLQNNGDISYDILFRKDNGEYQSLVVSEDGRVVRNEAGARSIETTTRGRVTVLQYSDVPEKVRQVAGQHLKDGHVEKVERSAENGELVYDIHFRKNNSEVQRLVIAESGRVVRDSPGRRP